MFFARSAHRLVSAATLLGFVALSADVRAQSEDEPGTDQPTGDSPPESPETPPGPPDEPDAGPGLFAGPYDFKPYVRPLLSSVLFASDDDLFVGIGLGARAGLGYHNDREGAVVVGDVYASGSYIVGSATGYDIRIGNMIGPLYKVIGISTGPEVAINQFGYGNVDLGNATTLRWYLAPYLTTKVFDAGCGIAPGWYLAGDRESLGNGLSEYSLFASAGVKVSKLRVGVSWSRLTLAGGEQQGFGVSLGI